ncbi:GNAT family N-acetyltransferase [Cohnella sp. WQ 127256]|uniref:GNAT family N-acetyltransferase n=1 Tax=Cohnella sp. WQ 127256 TaxID=2938790 RepID=UPI0021177FA0|nr:GNAT family N-acetyltransferase [Cohnella sp. WQ 127256]
MSIFTSVNRAEPEDTQEIMRLLVNTAEWLLRKGSSQWSHLLRGEDSHNTPEAINRGEVYLFNQEEQTVGMVILLQKPNSWDHDLWGERANDDQAIYVHRLAINRKFAGKGYGKHMMKWIEDTGASQLDKGVIRLDCLAHNEVLNEFYSGLGYEHIGKASNSHGDFNKFEKKL